MVLSLLPMPALAVEDPAISIGGVAVDNNDWYAITDTNGTVTTESAISANCNIHVVVDDVNDTATVTLKNATIANLSNTHAIKVTGYDLNIVLEGTANQIGVGTTNGYGYAIYSSTGNKVTITGQGDLTLKGSYGININGLGEVNIDTTGNLNIASEWQMVNTPGNITVAAKSIEATGYYFYGNAVSLTATDGDIYSTGSGQYGIQASGDVTVTAPNGAISVEGTGHAIKAMDYSINLAAKNDVTLNGTVYGKEISITSEAGNLTINGHYEAIEGTQTSVTLSAPSGDIILSANNSSSIISGSNNFTLAITAGGKLEAEGPYGIQVYESATIKADKVSVENTADGYGFNGGALTITSPSGGNCSEVYVSGGRGSSYDAIKACRDVNIKADKVMIIAGLNAEHAINASSIMGDVTVTIGDTGLIVGSINIKGTNAISAGILHAEKNGNQASYGLNLNTNTPSQSTYYKAGEGYVIFTPAEGETKATLLLNNATIHNQTTLTDNAIGMENEGIALPTGNIIIKVEGTNSITSSYGDGIGYFGSHVTLTGSGVLTVEGAVGEISLDDGSFSFTDDSNVTLNSVVSIRNDNTSQNTDTVYGNMTVGTYFRSLYRDAIIAKGATVTIPEGERLWLDETDSITINGQIINNGTIVLPYNYTIQQIQALNLTGNILMRDVVENKYRIYVDGNIYAYGGNVNYNFSIASAPTEVTYYKTINGYFIFTPASGDTQAKLELHNVDVFGDFALPDIPLTLYLEGENSIESINASASIIIEGNGKLDVYDFENSNADATLTVSSSAKLNTIYKTTADNITTNTIYGSRMVSEDARLYVSPSNKWVLAPNAVFTLEENGNLEFYSGATLDDLIIGDGAVIINNNYITLPIGTTAEQIEAIHLSGSGLVRVATAYDNHGYPETWDTYTNEGLGLKIVTGNIDLTDGTDHSSASLENDGYEWDAENKTLKLGNAYISGNIILPAGSVIDNTSNSIIDGIIDGKDGEACDIRIIGSASLTVNGISGGGTNGDTITISDGANVTVNGSINIGASGGMDGTLNVLGNGTVVNVINSYGSAVYCDTVNIDDGASLIASSEYSVGVFAQTGVSVKGGSSLVTNCEYGVYVLGGKLEVEHGSKLITNGSVAPFCVVAPQGQPQSETILLPGIPSGTEIAYVEGTYTGYGNLRSYWSLVPTGGSLSVSNEQNDQVDLSGAFIGPATFQSNLAESEITVLGTYTYNGTAQIPTIENVIVTLDSGNHTVGSSNYDITASNNVNAGTATLTVTAKDSSNYAGTKSTTFTINDGGSSSGGNNSGGSSQTNTYKLTFDTNGGSKISDVSKASGTVIDLSEYKPIRAGFEFNGWYKDEALTDKVSKITLDKNTTIYAKWIEMTTEAKNPFIDVDKNAYYHDAVMWAVEKGNTSGTSANTFSPEMITTRAQMATFLWRTVGMPEATLANSNFNDMDKDSYYYKAVLWAEENGVTVGTSSTTFSPEEKVTRGQVVSFLWRLDGKTASSSVNPFIDINNGMYYYEAILWAVDKGITYGTSEVEYSPDAPCLRAHIVTFLYRQLAE
jgi:uncharacterized repeat protein (TIGR02543 family)